MNNLKIISSTEEARRRGQLGGKKSVEARRRKKLLKESMLLLLNTKYKSDDGKVSNGFQKVDLALYNKALEGDVSAFNAIRDLIGEKPTDNINMDNQIQVVFNNMPMKDFSKGQDENDN